MAKETKLHILDAAETLFAEQGFAHTSLREITRKANVNLAAVNYHFGSKKNLIQDVLKRYFDVLMPQIDGMISRLSTTTGSQGVSIILSGLVPPMLSLSEISADGTEKFVQLLGRGYSETQGHLRKFILGNYGVTVTALVKAIRNCLPQLSDSELFWRLHFAIGSFVFSMASSHALKDIAQADFDQQVEIEDVILHLVPFVSEGIASRYT